jgi:hypothetical protein
MGGCITIGLRERYTAKNGGLRLLVQLGIDFSEAKFLWA